MLRSSIFCKPLLEAVKPKSTLQPFRYSFSTATAQTTLHKRTDPNSRNSLYTIRSDSLQKFKYHGYAGLMESALWETATIFTIFVLPFPQNLLAFLPLSIGIKSGITGVNDLFSHKQLMNKEICTQIRLLDEGKLYFENADGTKFTSDYVEDKIEFEKADWDEIIAEYNKGTARYAISQIKITRPNEQTPSYTGFLMFDMQHSAVGNIELLERILNKKINKISEADDIKPNTALESLPRTYTQKTVYKYTMKETKTVFFNHLPSRMASAAACTLACGVLYHFDYNLIASVFLWTAAGEAGSVMKYFWRGRFEPIKICSEIKVVDDQKLKLKFHSGETVTALANTMEILYIDRWNSSLENFLAKVNPNKMIPIKCSAYIVEKKEYSDFDIYLDVESTEVENLAFLESILKGNPKAFEEFKMIGK